VGGKLFSRSLRTPERRQAEIEREKVMDGLRAADEATVLERYIARLQAARTLRAASLWLPSYFSTSLRIFSAKSDCIWPSINRHYITNRGCVLKKVKNNYFFC
jgi:hypothetical protein